jgi:hypothetical protein
MSAHLQMRIVGRLASITSFSYSTNMPGNSLPPRYEADMYPFVARQAGRLAGVRTGAVAFSQVHASFGIPDLVFAVFDENVLASRVESGLRPILDTSAVAALLYLARRFQEFDDRSASIAEITPYSGISPSYLSSVVLPRLCEGGHVERVSRGMWAATHPFDTCVTRLVTVEAKLRSWRSGLGQARRYGVGSDRTWLIIDESHSRSALGNSGVFAANGIGLATLTANGKLCIKERAVRRNPSRIHRETLAERLAAMSQMGVTSGSYNHLFGQPQKALQHAQPVVQVAGIVSAD